MRDDDGSVAEGTKRQEDRLKQEQTDDSEDQVVPDTRAYDAQSLADVRATETLTRHFNEGDRNEGEDCKAYSFYSNTDARSRDRVACFVKGAGTRDREEVEADVSERQVDSWKDGSQADAATATSTGEREPQGAGHDSHGCRDRDEGYKRTESEPFSEKRLPRFTCTQGEEVATLVGRKAQLQGLQAETPLRQATVHGVASPPLEARRVNAVATQED